MGLPQPISVTDEYLAAIHGVLGEIRDRLPEPKDKPKAGVTKVAEPAQIDSGGSGSKGGSTSDGPTKRAIRSRKS